jgi:glutamate-1-semialdehyde aminotransferase
MARTPAIDFEHYQRSNESIGQGYLTNSKNPDCFIKGVYPTHIIKAKGCYLYDQKENQFVDWICGLGSNLFGYGNKLFTDVAYNELLKGINTSIPSRTEVYAAEDLKNTFQMDRVKFLKTGTEACMAALKIARNYTMRDVVLTQGYHGWNPEFTSLTPPAGGCTSHVFIHSLESIEQINSDIAAVIIEPVMLDYSLERIKWLRKLREKCTSTGTMLIFDEVITGMRFKNLSVSKFSGVDPDLLILGKAIAGGAPLAAVLGRHDLMDDKNYFVSSTFAGDNMALAMCRKVLDLLKNDYDYSINDLWGYGEDFISEFNSIWPEKLIIDGYPTRGAFMGDEKIKWLFWQEACKMGMLFGPSWFISFPHRDVSRKCLAHIKDIFNKIKHNPNLRLEGDEPCPPFTSRSRT